MTELLRTPGQTSMLPGAVRVGDLLFASGIAIELQAVALAVSP